MRRPTTRRRGERLSMVRDWMWPRGTTRRFIFRSTSRLKCLMAPTATWLHTGKLFAAVERLHSTSTGTKTPRCVGPKRAQVPSIGHSSSRLSAASSIASATRITRDSSGAYQFSPSKCPPRFATAISQRKMSGHSSRRQSGLTSYNLSPVNRRLPGCEPSRRQPDCGNADVSLRLYAEQTHPSSSRVACV